MCDGEKEGGGGFGEGRPATKKKNGRIEDGEKSSWWDTQLGLDRKETIHPGGHCWGEEKKDADKEEEEEEEEEMRMNERMKCLVVGLRR